MKGFRIKKKHQSSNPFGILSEYNISRLLPLYQAAADDNEFNTDRRLTTYEITCITSALFQNKSKLYFHRY
jgi:hypothetical protein